MVLEAGKSMIEEIASCEGLLAVLLWKQRESEGKIWGVGQALWH
jgi:hypothetical protein